MHAIIFPLSAKSGPADAIAGPDVAPVGGDAFERALRDLPAGRPSASAPADPADAGMTKSDVASAADEDDVGIAETEPDGPPTDIEADRDDPEDSAGALSSLPWPVGISATIAAFAASVAGVVRHETDFIAPTTGTQALISTPLSVVTAVADETTLAASAGAQVPSPLSQDMIRAITAASQPVASEAESALSADPQSAETLRAAQAWPMTKIATASAAAVLLSPASQSPESGLAPSYWTLRLVGQSPGAKLPDHDTPAADTAKHPHPTDSAAQSPDAPQLLGTLALSADPPPPGSSEAVPVFVGFPAAPMVSLTAHPSGSPMAHLTGGPAGGSAATLLPPGLGADLNAIIALRPDGPVEISLSPDDLGRLRVTLWHAGDRLHVLVQAERGETLDLLRRNSDALSQEISDAGFAGGSFSFSGWGDSHKPAPAAEMVRAEAHAAEPSVPTAAFERTETLDAVPGLDLRL